MPQIKSSFILNSQSPNFGRDLFATLADLRNANPNYIDPGHISYCLEDRHHYKFDIEYGLDDVTGYWRLLLESSPEDLPSHIGILQFETLEEMALQEDPIQYKMGQIAYCIEDDSHYFWGVQSGMTTEELNSRFSVKSGYFIPVVRIPDGYENIYTPSLSTDTFVADPSGVEFGKTVSDYQRLTYDAILEKFIFHKVIPSFVDPTASIRFANDKYSKIMKIGVKNPTPARASAPKPDTHAASIRLYKLEISNEIIRGIDILSNARLGFPSIISTLLSESLLNMIKY